MKVIVLAVILAAWPFMLLAGEIVAFETAKKPKVGESNAFKLTENDRSVIKGANQDYISIELVESSREDGGDTFTEGCRLRWTWIGPSGIRGGIATAFVRYRSEKTSDNESALTKIGGSETIEVGDLSIGWSYGSPKEIFLYPSPGTEYATVDVEGGGDGQ